MLTVSTAVTQAALHRKESRGGHTREGYPNPDPEMGKVNFVQRQTDERGPYAPITINPEPEARLVINVGRTVLHYLDSKLSEPSNEK